jgi:alpha-D-xyloside xylohydrolase
VFGLRFQDAMQELFERRKARTYGLVRSSGALAAPYPYVLYSDLYDHTQFIRGLVNAGFSGLLWTPELREATSTEDLLRRLETVLFSPMALLNAWYLRNPPWKQVDRDQNNAGRFTADWKDTEARVRTLIELRMRLVPYLQAAFVRYHREGVPPFRALVMDDPDDPQLRAIDDQYMMGERLMVAPVVAGKPERSVYLPKGAWFDYWTGKRLAGGQRFTVRPPVDQIPLFVKAGTLLPLAEPTLHTDDPASFRLTVTVYGNQAAETDLYEEQDAGLEPALTELHLAWDPGRRSGALRRSRPASATAYQVTAWKVIE